MSHLIMLAPANFGSALAVLGKGRLGRMKSWFGGIEPGQGVLDWLALGSDEAWDLNTTWIRDGGKLISAKSVFPFVLSGQTIDRKLYDNLNNYTGETGSDGVVRVAGANLNSQLVKVAQEVARPAKKKGQFEAPTLTRSGPVYIAPASAMRVIGGKSHSGTSKGIMRSVKATLGRPKDAETVGCILDCLQVSTKTQYDALSKRFAEETAVVQNAERIEQQERFLRSDNYFVHDRYSMVIFRLTDHQGQPVNDFDLLLTAGEDDDPNHLPKGFFIDRQRNSKTPNIITYYFNHDVMIGCDAVLGEGGDVLRRASPGAKKLGLRVLPRPTDGFVHYLPGQLSANAAMLSAFLRPNQTTLVDIVLRRVVREGVFQIRQGTKAEDFKKTPKGTPIE